MSFLGSAFGKVVAVVLAGIVVSAAGLGAALSTGVVSPEPPSVESVENGWGEITDERTTIRTTITVDNPNEITVPGVAGVSYDVKMNDVEVASGDSGGIKLSPGRNDVTLETDIDNNKIPAWWASHINNGEQTTLSIEPTIEAASFSKELPGRDRTFETDILSSFDSDSGQSMEVGGRTLLTVEKTSASWGQATEKKTPLQFSGTVSNPNDVPLTFSKIGYTVSMNDVTVGEGTTEKPVEIGPQSTETIEVDSALDNQKLDDWWVSHLKNDEKTTLDVQVYALVDTDDGKRKVPLPFLSKRVVFETDILGGGQASTREVETDAGFDFQPPTVESTQQSWSESESGTQFATKVVVNNPNPANSTLGNVSLDAEYRVALNDVTLVEDSQRANLQPGQNELAFEGNVDDAAIREWWNSHVESGEQTKLTTEAQVNADLGFAEVPVSLPEENRTFETDMLSGFSNTEEEVEVQGVTLAVLSNMESDWGTPTAERTPMVVSGTITNERNREMTVVTFGYNVTMNDVVLADNESRVGTTVPGGETKNLETTGYLDNTKIPAWWASHLRNDERSELSVTYYAVVEFAGQRFTVELDSMSYNDTIETNAFGS